MMWLTLVALLVLLVLAIGARKRSKRIRSRGAYGWMSQSWLIEHRASRPS